MLLQAARKMGVFAPRSFDIEWQGVMGELITKDIAYSANRKYEESWRTLMINITVCYCLYCWLLRELLAASLILANKRFTPP